MWNLCIIGLSFSKTKSISFLSVTSKSTDQSAQQFGFQFNLDSLLSYLFDIYTKTTTRIHTYTHTQYDTSIFVALAYLAYYFKATPFYFILFCCISHHKYQFLFIIIVDNQCKNNFVHMTQYWSEEKKIEKRTRTTTTNIPEYKSSIYLTRVI